MLVRATRRAREIAVRRALGVTRGRLFEQLFTEAAVLTILAGVASIVLAIWVGSALRALLLPRVGWASGPLDLRTSLFALVITVGTAIIVGVVPAFRSWSIDVVNSLKAGTKNSGFGRSHLRTGLLVAQAALSVMLLVGAGLFVKSLRNVKNIDLGFDADYILTAMITADEKDISNDVARVMPAIIARVERMNGVEAAAAASTSPMQGNSVSRLFLPGKDSVPAVNGARGAYYTNVTRGYFRAAGLQLIAGRDFDAPDGSAMIVNEAMAKGWWPGESAIGKCVIRGTPTSPCIQVIGVVENTKNMSIMDENADAWYFVSSPDTVTSSQRDALIVRADPGRQHDLVAQIKAEIAALVPTAEIINVRPMMTDLEREMRPWRLGATIFTAMGVLALLVAAIGVYSVIAYSVSQRAHEMGVRIALGAQLRDISRLVVGEGLRTVSIGIIAGLLLSLAAGKLVASLLYGISPRDPAVMIGVAVLLAIVGMAASVIPAVRAGRVDPMTTLRVE
jgi:predicted permease